MYLSISLSLFSYLPLSFFYVFLSLSVFLLLFVSLYDIYSAVDWGKLICMYGQVSGSSLGHVSEWNFNLFFFLSSIAQLIKTNDYACTGRYSVQSSTMFLNEPSISLSLSTYLSIYNSPSLMTHIYLSHSYFTCQAIYTSRTFELSYSLSLSIYISIYLSHSLMYHIYLSHSLIL